MKIVNNSKSFLEIHTNLIEKGVKQKDIAKMLGLYPSAYSTLVNKVAKEIAQLTTPSEESVSEIFDKVSNVSAYKYNSNITRYIEQLEGYNHNEKNTLNSIKFIDDLIKKSPQRILQKLQGVYDCYYRSSFGYKLKCEPFLIKYNEINKTFECRKGNKLSLGRYTGVAYMSNNHMLSFQMKEMETLIPDHFVAHFHLPPSYDVTLNLLRGISVSMSNAMMPISRKVLLYKKSRNTDISKFEKIETKFYDESDDNAMLEYLNNTDSLVEYLPIPHPDYDKGDLEKELLILSVTSKSKETKLIKT